ncbi:MAG: hypothetical protein ACXQTS_06350, partial [Candidatus Methanospirareceae archaeon]
MDRRINFAGTPVRSADVYLTVLDIVEKGIAERVRALREEVRKELEREGEVWDIDHGTIVRSFLSFLTNGRVRIANTVLEQTKALKE